MNYRQRRKGINGYKKQQKYFQYRAVKKIFQAQRILYSESRTYTKY